MIEKKYLVTEDDLLSSVDLCEHCIGNGEDCHGDCLCADVANILESHEHVERTCRIEERDLDGNPVGDTVLGDGFCSFCWGIVEFEDRFCRHCSARMEDA